MSISVDIVIVSNATTQKEKKLTERCLNSLFENNQGFFLKPVVIEGNHNAYYYINNTITHHVSEKFNKRFYEEKGIRNRLSRYVVVCDNDHVFEKDWIRKHIGYNYIDKGVRIMKKYLRALPKKLETESEKLKGDWED